MNAAHGGPALTHPGLRYPVLFSVGFRAEAPNVFGPFFLARLGRGWIQEYAGDWNWVGSWGGTVNAGWMIRASEQANMGPYLGFTGFTGEFGDAGYMALGVSAEISF